MKKRLKLFLDSSAILTGLNKPTGAAGQVLSLGRLDYVEFIISDDIIDELSRNIQKKFIHLDINDFLAFQPTILPSPSDKEILLASKIISHQVDSPILASAIKTNPDFVITWNTKHFLTKSVVTSVKFIICTPPDFLTKTLKAKLTRVFQIVKLIQ